MIVMVVVAILFAALPQVLGLPFAQRLLKARADAILAPASVEFASIRLSWFQPTQIDDVVLRDKRASSVVVAKRAEFEWTLWQIVFARPESATLSLPEGVLDVTRSPDDGKINLYETLEPVLRGKPERELIIKIDRGRLTFRDKALSEPVVADRADILLDIAADPGPITWKLALANAAPGGVDGHFDVSGSHTRPADDEGDGDTTIAVKASRWALERDRRGGLGARAPGRDHRRQREIGAPGLLRVRDDPRTGGWRRGAAGYGPARLGGRWRQGALGRA